MKREVWAWRPGWLMAPVLGWAEERIEWEVDLYRRRGEAEMTNQSPPDDEQQRGTLGRAGEGH